MVCIAEIEAETVLQYDEGLVSNMYRNTKKLYCEKRVGQGWTVLQYSGQPSHDTAGAGCTGRRRGDGLGVRGVRALGAQAGRWARRRGAGRAGGALRRAGKQSARALACSTARGATGRCKRARAGGTGVQARGAGMQAGLGQAERADTAGTRDRHTQQAGSAQG